MFFKGKSTSSYISTAFTEVDKARGNDKLLCFILPVLFNLYCQFSAFQFEVDERFGCAVDTEACPLAGRCVRWWHGGPSRFNLGAVEMPFYISPLWCGDL